MALNYPVYPAWTAPGRSNWDQEDSAAQQAFMSGFNRSSDERSQMNLMTFQKRQQQEQAAMIAQRLTPVANALAGASTPEQAWDVVSKNPQWMADPIQGQFVDRYLKTQTDIAKAQAETLTGKMKIADTTAFLKRLSEIDPTDRAAIQGMRSNPDGSTSAGQWQALGLAEQRIQVAQENERKRAELEAVERGDVATTTISDKGVSTVFKPAPVTQDSAPKTMQIAGGATLAWMPGGKSIHVINPKGEKNELTPHQLRSIAEGLKRDDPRRTQIIEFLANQAATQTTTTSTPGLPAKPEQKILKYNPATGKLE